MEKDGTDIIHVSIESKETLVLLPVPDFNLVVVTTGYKKRLKFMEINATDRPYSISSRFVP